MKIACAHPRANKIEKVLLQRKYKNTVTSTEAEQYGMPCHDAYVPIDALGYLCYVKETWNVLLLHTRYLHECFSLNIKVFPLPKACHLQRAG